jgi:hypothetical protein
VMTFSPDPFRPRPVLDSSGVARYGFWNTF